MPKGTPDWPDKMTVQDEMLTIREAAELAGMSEHGIRTWIINGKLPAARYRYNYVISKMVLALVVAANRGGLEKDSIEGVGMDALLTEVQAAKILNVSRQRVHQLIYLGKIPSISFGPRVVRIVKQDLEKFIENRVSGVPPAPAPLEMMTVDEVAEQLRISPASVTAAIKRGDLKATWVGNAWKIRARDLRGYVRRNTTHHGRPVTEIVGRSKKIKPVKMRVCSYCSGTYPDRGYAEHINDAEHIRARGLRSGTSRV
jgi:excisionase family DNA binding protein